MSSATCRVLLGHVIKRTREQSQGGCVEGYLNCKYKKGKWLLFARVRKPLDSLEESESQLGMGNVCGCVRGHKDECYVDPSKAPLSPMSRELRGRRYFQRRKSRKSVELQPSDTVRSQSDTEKNEKFCDPVDQGVYVGEVPVLKTIRRPGVQQSEKDRNFLTIEQNLHKVTKSSKCISPKDGLLGKKLLQRQLRRAASFGAVEHLLRTVWEHGSRRGSGDHQWENIQGLSRIICDIHVHRKRRRAYTSSGGLVSHNSLGSIQRMSASCNEHEVTVGNLYF